MEEEEKKNFYFITHYTRMGKTEKREFSHKNFSYGVLFSNASVH